MPGWVHEHCYGTDRGIRGRAAEGQIWRLLHPWQQCAVYFGGAEIRTTSCACRLWTFESEPRQTTLKPARAERGSRRYTT